MGEEIKKIVNEIWHNYNKMDEAGFCHYMVERFGVDNAETQTMDSQKSES